MLSDIFYKRVLPVVFCLVAATDILCAFWWRRGDLLAFYEDDFFYYLKVAESILVRHLSTFDGNTLTNGYHPLWMLVLVGLLLCFKGKAFFLALGIVTSAAVMVLFFLCRCLCQAFGASPQVSGLSSFMVCFWAEKLMKGGMEETIAIPLFVAVALYVSRVDFHWETRQCLIYGFVSSLAVLARLDVALFFLLLLTFQGIAARRDGFVQWLRRCLLFGAGGLLLPVYFAVNYTYFGTLTPISSVAKHMKSGFVPCLVPVAGLLPINLAGRRYEGWFIAVPLLISFLGLVVWIYQLASRRTSFSPVIAASLIFPFFHIGVLSVLSDWPLWQWYFYPLVLSCLFSLVLLAKTSVASHLFAQNHGLQFATAILLVGVFVGRTAYRTIQRPVGFNPMYQAALDIVAFDKDHRGRYAMGDRAGTVGYLLPDPLVQLEGIVMDKTYLTNLRSRRNLIDVLRDYHVNYYVSTNPEMAGGCYRFVEPAKAGPLSPKMRGELCENPLMMVVHQGITTAVFGVPY